MRIQQQQIVAARQLFLAVSRLASHEEQDALLNSATEENPELGCYVKELLIAARESRSGALDRVRAALNPADQDTADDVGNLAGIDLTSQPFIGPYRLIENIGAGGFGTVYSAEQTHPVKRMVALKILNEGRDSRQILARFEVERQALAMMEHPNICRIIDGGETDTGRPYFVMELVKGVPLTEYCNEARLTIRERLRLFADVCSAVQHAHQKGIIHRDIKPSNVLVSVQNSGAMVKVIDFGIARVISQPLTMFSVSTGFHEFLGTPMYMSPEQAQRNRIDIDTRSDVYSLGMLLYELLTGTTPFELFEMTDDGIDEMRRVIREVDPLRPSRRVSGLSEELRSRVAKQRQCDPHRLSCSLQRELDWVVMKAIDKDRTRRYDSPNTLAADVQRYLSDEPVLACPPSFSYQLGKFGRRNSKLIATVAVVILALFAGSAMAMWQAVVANRERIRANETAARMTEESYRAAENARLAEEKAKLADQQRLRAEAAEFEQRRQTERSENLLYASAIRLAFRHQQSGDHVQTQQLLDAWLPQPERRDLRGLEWQLLKKNHLLPGDYLLQLPGDVSCTRLSPDGLCLVAATNGGTIQRYSLSEKKPLESWETGLTDVRRIDFSPDGRHLALISYEAAAVLLDTRTGQVKLRCPVPAVATKNPDVCFVGGQLLTSGNQGRISFWNLERYELEKIWDTGHDLVLEFADDPLGTGVYIVVSDDGEKVPCQVRHLSNDEVPVFSQPMLLWFAPSSIAISPDGRIIALGNTSGELMLWDRQIEQFIGNLQLVEKINDLCFSPDGDCLAAAERTGTVHLWRWKQALAAPANSQQCHSHWPAHARPARSVCFTPDSESLISAGFDGRIARWDCNHEPANKMEIPAKGGCRQVVVLRGASKVVAWCLDALRVFDINSGNVLFEKPYKPEPTSIQRLASDDTGSWLAYADSTSEIYCSNVTNTSLLEPLPDSATANDGLERLAFLPGTLTLLAIESRPELRIRGWDVQQRQLLFDHRLAGIVPVKIALTQNDRRILAFLDSGVIRIDPVSGKLRELWPYSGGSVSAVAESCDGTMIAIAHNDRVISLVDTDTGVKQKSLTGHLGAVHSLKFSSDGRTLLALDTRGDLRFWHVESGSELLTWPPEADIQSFDLSFNGQIFAVAEESTISLYKADVARPGLSQLSPQSP